MYKGVLFDWDGTLADTRKVVLTSFQKALKTVNIQTPPEYIERRIGTGAAQTFKEILLKAGKHPSNAVIEQLIDVKIRAEVELTGKVKLFPGAKKLLQTLQGNAKLALASMNNRSVIDHLLKALALEDCFNIIVTVEDVQKFKPHPEIFLKAATKLRLPPKECVVVEDSVFGVQAAKAAGTTCIAVLTGAYKQTELKIAGSDLIVNSLREKEKILNLILQ